MYTTDRCVLSRSSRFSLALAGGLLTLLVTLAALSTSASASESEMADLAPAPRTTVPEPATLVFFGAAATAIFRRRWTQAIR